MYLTNFLLSSNKSRKWQQKIRPVGVAVQEVSRAAVEQVDIHHSSVSHRNLFHHWTGPWTDFQMCWCVTEEHLHLFRLNTWWLSLDHLLFSSLLSAGVDSTRRGLHSLSSSLTHQRCRLPLGPDDPRCRFHSCLSRNASWLMPRPGRTEATPPDTQKVGALRRGSNQLHMQHVGGRKIILTIIICDRRAEMAREQCTGGDSHRGSSGCLWDWGCFCSMATSSNSSSTWTQRPEWPTSNTI